MNLVVTTPFAVAVEASDVRSVRAEDASGSFGILPGHADLLTALPVSVLSWRDAANTEHHVAVRGGVMEIRDGRTVSVAAREAVAGDDLAQLEAQVLAQYRQRLSDEQDARRDSRRLSLAAVRQVIDYLRPEREVGP